MKKLFSLALLILGSQLFSQDFTWVRGSSSNGTITGVYGTQGVSSPLNEPGTRHGCATWTDAAGNLWLFGGEGISSTTPLCWLNDLWKYNIATNEWTWIRGTSTPNSVGIYGTQGVSAPTNEPGAREFCVSWKDAAGNFWLYGGEGFASNATLGRLGDLWKYSPTTNEWTWMSGHNTVDANGVYGTMGTSAATNLPGCRYAPSTWTDANGDFWMFGGKGFDATNTSDGYLNDLWKYDVTNNEWTWINGTNLEGQNGVYSALSITSPTNMPGGREFSGSWKDELGNFYMFGGIGMASTITPNQGYLNDLWKYNPTTNVWTWINGANITNQWGTYGTQGTAAAVNSPGSRLSSAFWEDLSGNFWLFGGFGFATSSTGSLNDVWRYNPKTNQWAWMKGATTIAQNGTYGSMGVTAPTNIPGSRRYNTFWRHAAPKLWLFGGLGMDAAQVAPDNMNDLWYFEPPCSNADSVVAATEFICSGNFVSIKAHSSFPATVAWYGSPTSTTAIGSGSVFNTPTLNAVSSQSIYTYYVESNSCTVNQRAMVTITVGALPTLVATATKTLFCSSPQQVVSTTVNVSGASTYTWSNLENASSFVYTIAPSAPNASVQLEVTGKDQNNCENKTSLIFKFSECLSLENEFDLKTVSVYPNPNNGNFIISTSENLIGMKLVLINAIGQNVYQQTLNGHETHIKPNLPNGIYFYELIGNHKNIASGKLIIE